MAACGVEVENRLSADGGLPWNPMEMKVEKVTTVDIGCTSWGL